MKSKLSLHPFWDTDASLSLLLVTLVLVTFVIHPFLPTDGAGRVLLDLGMTLVLVFGSGTLLSSPALGKILLASMVFAVSTQWLIYVYDHKELEVANQAATLVFLLAMVLGLSARVYRQGEVGGHRLQGAVALYLLLGYVWTFAYALLLHADPTAIQRASGESVRGAVVVAEAPATEGAMQGPEPSKGLPIGDLNHFSFVTLTTLGYGDILPVSQAARSLAALEALIGQLFLAIVVARLVALQITQPPPPTPGEGDGDGQPTPVSPG